MTAPLLPVAVIFAAGVGLGLHAPTPLWVAPGALLLAALALVGVRRRRLTAAGAAVCMLVFLAGWARLALPDPLPAATGLEPGLTSLEGIVSGDPERDGPRTELPLLVTGVVGGTGVAPARAQLVVQLYGAVPPLRPGEGVRLAVTLVAARPFRNPDRADVGHAAGERRARLIAVGRGDTVERRAGARVPWWLAVRVWVHEVVKAQLPPVSGALFEGLLIGERRRLPPTLLADFRAAGVFHILAISGFNVGLVAVAVVFALRLCRVPSRVGAGVALAALAAFAAVVGSQPSVLRATVMAALILTARLIGRESGLWNSLAAALVALLALDPAALGDAGLQLSFAATAGILHLSPPILAALEPRWPRPLAAAVAVSAGAQLAVTPLMLFHWNQLSLVGIVANLFVVPLAGVLTTLGLGAVMLAVVSETLAHLLFQTLWLLLLALRLAVRAFAALPGAMVHGPTPSPLAMVAATAALLVTPAALRGHRGARVAALGLAAVAGLGTVAGFLPDGRLHVLMLDVGQGDAILVRGPDGRALLVDTGGGGPGRADRGERVVLPVLHRAGIRRLAALAVTHGDPDHAGGLASLVDGMPVDEVWVPAGTEDAPWQRPLVAAGVPRRVLARGDRLWLGPVLVTVLHPPRVDRLSPSPWSADENNSSLVLRVEWGAAALLLTGDAEAKAEGDILAAGLPLQASVLKVGHHGSRHASSMPFLAAVAPRVALISAGARNPFGHPTPAALARLADAGAALYRTDYDGAVEVTTDAARLWTRRWARPDGEEEFLLRGAP